MDAVLGRALEAITLRIQLMSGKSTPDLSNPDDKSAATELLARVHGHGIPVIPGEVGQWALDNGWHSPAAQELMGAAVLATNTHYHSAFLTGYPFWQANVIELLEAEDATVGEPTPLMGDKCTECAMWGRAGTSFKGCLMDVIKAQWSRPYWLKQHCVYPGGQLSGLVDSPPALPI